MMAGGILKLYYNVALNLGCFNLGLIHTRHFCTQYFDKKIKRHFDKNIFFLQNNVMTFQNI